MKTKLIKSIMAAAMAVLLASGLTVGAAAADLQEAGIAAVSSDSEIMPLSDVIVIKTRTYNGVKQYRRWNETRKYWVDPDWIDC